MHCPNCNAPLEEGAAFCGNCGKQVAPLLARGATVADHTEIIRSNATNNATGAETIYPPQSQPSTPAPPQGYSTYQPPSYQQPNYQQRAPQVGNMPSQPPVMPPAQTGRGLSTRTVAFIAIILLLLVLSVSAGVLALNNRGGGITQTGGKGNAGGAAASPTTGAATNVAGLAAFSDSQNSTTPNSTLKITANALKEPPSGSHYHAWVVDSQNESSIVSIGPLALQPDKSYIVTGSTSHTNLIGAGNKIEVTLEKGDVSVPVGNVVLSGTFPPEAFVHIRHLLFHFDTTPNNVGLLVGTREQARLLNAQTLLLKSNMHNQQVATCALQNIINIVEGQNGAHFQQPTTNCQTLNMVEKGDGFGLIGNKGYIHTASLHASLAATQADSTAGIKLHAGHVRIAMDNMSKWGTTIDNDAVSLLTKPNDMGKMQEIITLSDHMLNGVDLNNDEHIDPIPGEAGAITAYQHGQLMAMLQLRPGA